MHGNDQTRRHVLTAGGTLVGAAVSLGGIGTVAANPGKRKGTEKGNGKTFGRVYANDVLWRTNVVKTLDAAPSPNDDIYFLHDGTKPIVARDDVNSVQTSPFVSESAPGDRDWNGGKWVHYSAEVTDIDAFNDDAPLDDTDEFVGAGPTDSTKSYIEITRGRPLSDETGDRFGPPNFFVCPLNGRV